MDLIDRQAAIDIAKDLLIKMDEYHQYNQAVNNYCAELMKLPSAHPKIIRYEDCEQKGNPMDDLIERQAAIDALWKALYKYEDKTEKQFLESEELDVDKWMVHRIFVQNMNDIDRQTILNLPSVQLEPCDDPRADVYYLAEKIGIHRLYALVVELRGEPELCENQAARRLNDLIFDINPTEICSQIRSDNLRNWCETIQTEMKIAMVQLPCWSERRTDE